MRRRLTRIGGRSSRASKRPTPVPDVQEIGSSDEYSDYEQDAKEEKLKGNHIKREQTISRCLDTDVLTC